MGECEHTTLVFVSETVREVPEGYDQAMAKEDFDLEDYHEISWTNRTVCQDCKKVLEEQ